MQHFIRIKADFEENGETIPLTLAEVLVDPDFETESYEIAHTMAAADEMFLALCHISLASQNSMSSKSECGEIARAVLKKVRKNIANDTPTTQTNDCGPYA